jgi:hypothetical protein
MIKKIIFAALLFFVGYNLYLYFVKPVAGPGQHQWQKNIILMQDYADFHQDDSVVIVGTSLSARLYNNLLPHGFYNLSLAGGSIYEGLAIVKENPRKPKYVLIESNLFDKEPDKEAISGIFDPFMQTLRKWIPSIREAYQPANLLTPYLGYVAKEKPEKTIRDTGITNMLLRQRIKQYQVVPDNAVMDKNLQLLKKYVTDLQSAGVKVIFYEIPENCELLKTPKYLIPKQKIINVFPANQYHWMPEPDCSLYQYSDGSHMAYESAGDFVNWFVKKFENLRI